jgi:hypothetical protein
VTTTKETGTLALEALKDRASKSLIQLIYQASQGQQYVNIQLARNIIEDIVMATLLENQLLINTTIKQE